MIIKLKNIGTIITGNTPSKKNAKYYDSNDIYFIKPDTLDDSKITVLNSSNEFISNNARDKARIVGKNAILITCIGSIGKVGIVTEGEYAFNQQINAIIPNELVIPKYLAYCLLFNKDKLIDIANAPVVPIINKSQFGEFEIIINEDLYVQQKIVNELNIIQEIILKQRQELEKMNDLIKARFIEMFGAVKENPYKYPTATLKEVCFKITDGKHGGCEQEEDSGYYYIGAREIYDGEIHYDTAPQIKYTDFSKDYRRCNIEQGDMVIVNTGATIGKSAIASSSLTERTLLQKSVALIKVKPNIISAEFLRYCYIANPSMYMVESASAQPNLLLSKINTTVVYLPPIGLQQQFADFVKQVDKSKLAVQQSLEKTQQLFDSLMQEYFG